MPVTNLLRGALAGAIGGLLLVLTWRRVVPEVGIWAGTIAGAAMFGAVLGLAFLSLYDGKRRFVLQSVLGWACAGLVLCAFVQAFHRPTQSLATTCLIGSVGAGLVGGASFGHGWGGPKGGLLIGGASLLGFPLAMVFGWWSLQAGAAWLDASGLGTGNRVVVFALADVGFIVYGALVGLLTPLCEEHWVAESTQTERAPEDITAAIHAGTREGRAEAASGRYAAVGTTVAAATGIPVANALATPQAPRIAAAPPASRDADTFEFDDSDVALTPFEEQNPEAETEAFDLGEIGGRPSSRRLLHPDYAPAGDDTRPGDPLEDPALRHPRIEVELESDDGELDVAMDDDDEYGFLEED